MACMNTAAETPNGSCGPPGDRFVSGSLRPSTPATTPRLILRHRQRRACGGAIAANRPGADGLSENHPQRHRVRSTDPVCWTSESFLGRGSIGRNPTLHWPFGNDSFVSKSILELRQTIAVG